jgi:hypothetical protein
LRRLFLIMSINNPYLFDSQLYLKAHQDYGIYETKI